MQQLSFIFHFACCFKHAVYICIFTKLQRKSSCEHFLIIPSNFIYLSQGLICISADDVIQSLMCFVFIHLSAG